MSYKVYREEPPHSLTPIAAGKAHHVGVRSREEPYIVHHRLGEASRSAGKFETHREAARAVLEHLRTAGIPIDAIGHRFVHGGTLFQASTLIDDDSLPRLEAAAPLAPVHNPNSLSVIHLCLEELPETPQFAVFDTAFHAAIPEKAYRYALPYHLADEMGLRKYGFHGLSYQYISRETSRFLGIPLKELKIVACHLGTGGSSACAIQGGRSVETSMGFSPLPGLIMSTRSGDLDPSILLALIEKRGYSVAQIDRLLNKESGLIGISGISSDLFELVRAAEEGNERASLAVDMYVHRLKSYIGAYLAVLGGADALVFTDDIGARCWQIREKACEGLEELGIVLDRDANRGAEGLRLLSSAESKLKVLSMPTDEEIVIAEEGVRMLKK